MVVKISIVVAVLLSALLVLGAMRFLLPDSLQALSADLGAVVGVDIPEPDEVLEPIAPGGELPTVSTPTIAPLDADDLGTNVTIPPMPPPDISIPSGPPGY